jgi:hypothetical protein
MSHIADAPRDLRGGQELTAQIEIQSLVRDVFGVNNGRENAGDRQVKAA